MGIAEIQKIHVDADKAKAKTANKMIVRPTFGKKPGIKKATKKRAKANRVYDKKAREFRKANPICAIRSPACTGATECVNHKKGKATPALLIDERFWEPSCFMCNGYIEDHHEWAEENGHKISRHKK